MSFRPRNILKISFTFLLLTACFTFFKTNAQPVDPNNVYEQVTQVGADVPVDMDQDGIPNWWELLYGLDPTDPSDAALDPDGDTLTNLVEYQHRTNPLSVDTDGGGVWDNLEIELCNSPLDPTDDNDGENCISHVEIEGPKDPRGDSDGDGLSNFLEKDLGTDQHSVDTDNDGVNDYDEVYTHLTNPLVADTDLDGLSDSEEIYTYSTDPNNRDSDFDGLSDAEELFTYSTNPNYWDTDGGGMSDADELTNGSDPNNKSDDFKFTWSIYYGNQPNNLLKSLRFNKIDIYQGMDVTIEAVMPDEADRITIKFNDKIFDSEKEYIKLKLLSPNDPGIYTIEFTLRLKNDQTVRMTKFIEVKQRGRVMSRVDGKFNDLYNNFDYFETQPVDGAKIEVFVYSEVFDEMQLYNSDIFDVANPQYTDHNGTYILTLHPGNYLIKISKPEFGTKEILHNTETYSIYSQDVYIDYNHDNYVWAGIFVSIFMFVWVSINLIDLVKHLISYIISQFTKHKPKGAH